LNTSFYICKLLKIVCKRILEARLGRGFEALKGLAREAQLGKALAREARLGKAFEALKGLAEGG
jgi:hypothetical protein